MTQLGCEFDRGEIPTARERITGADGANEFAVEIFRVVVGKTVGRIRQDRQWMNQSLLERERIDERLQSGTGRARRRGSVTLSLYLSVKELRRADLRQHIHVAGIDQQRGSIANPATAICPNIICDPSLDQLLLWQIQRGDDVGGAAALRGQDAAARRLYHARQHSLNKVRR